MIRARIVERAEDLLATAPFTATAGLITAPHRAPALQPASVYLIEGISDLLPVVRSIDEIGLPMASDEDAVAFRATRAELSALRERLLRRTDRVADAVVGALETATRATRDIVWEGGRLELSRRVHVMGIVNVTPDSFSDGGLYVEREAAVKHGSFLADQGADILDIGGESTRPGAAPVSPDEEIERVVPVIEDLAKRIQTPISIDTMKPSVAAAALDAGAAIVNDVSAGADPDMLPLVAARGAPIVLMHMRGEPRTMQANPVYQDVVGDICAFLAERAAAARAAGVEPNRIVLDPGFGFGKTPEHNLIMLRRLREFTGLGYPLLVGTSRKSFIGAVLDAPVEDRLEGTAATVTLAVASGASIVRVHDVASMRRVAGMVEAVERSNRTGGGT